MAKDDEQFPTPIFDRELERYRKRGGRLTVLQLSQYRRNKPRFFWFLMNRHELLAAALSDALAYRNISNETNGHD